MKDDFDLPHHLDPKSYTLRTWQVCVLIVLVLIMLGVAIYMLLMPIFNI